MKNERKEVAARFAKVLREKLTDRFGDMPSAARVANHFNLRAHGTGAITTEAARRWIKGLSVPELARFRVLSEWLGISTSDFLDLQEGSNDSDHLPTALGLLGKLQSPSHLGLINAVSAGNKTSDIQEKNFLRLFKLLNASERDGIVIAVWALLRAQQNVSSQEKL